MEKELPGHSSPGNNENANPPGLYITLWYGPFKGPPPCVWPKGTEETMAQLLDQTLKSCSCGNAPHPMRPGRPKGNGTSLSEKLRVTAEDKDALLSALRSRISGSRGKAVAAAVVAAVELGLMERPTFGELADAFGEIGNESGYCRYYRLYDNRLRGTRGDRSYNADVEREKSLLKRFVPAGNGQTSERPV